MLLKKTTKVSIIAPANNMGFMQVGLDIGTSTNYKSQLLFQPDEYLSAFVHNFIKVFSSSSGCGQTEY